MPRALLEAAGAIACDRDRPRPLGLRPGRKDWAGTASATGSRLVEGTISRSSTRSPAKRLTAWCWISGSRRCSSTRPERGFSFLREGPLDMRMRRQRSRGLRIWSMAPARRRSPISCSITAKSARRGGLRGRSCVRAPSTRRLKPPPARSQRTDRTPVAARRNRARAIPPPAASRRSGSR